MILVGFNAKRLLADGPKTLALAVTGEALRAIEQQSQNDGVILAAQPRLDHEPAELELEPIVLAALDMDHVAPPEIEAGQLPFEPSQRRLVTASSSRPEIGWPAR
jgi:hypothetical protein